MASELDVGTCKSVIFEMRSNTPGVQFVDSAGQVGWTPVVKRKQRRKSMKNGIEIDSDTVTKNNV